MKQDVNEDLLIKYIIGEATPVEQEEVDLWIKASDANARTFEQFKFILESSKQLAQESPADVTAEWEKFKIKREAPKNQTKVRFMTRWMQVAAAILILMVGVWAGHYFYNRQTYPGAAIVTLSAQNKLLTDTLPDGSVVHMNKNSSISYARNFKGRREIKLTGEAFFTVKHDESAPFTVHAGNVNINDVGTAFNVKNKNGYIEVIVESGIVQVNKNALSVRLVAGEMVRIKPDDQQLTKEANTDLLYNYYWSNQFILNKAPLWRVVETLNKVYDAHIKIEGNELQNTQLTLPFDKNDSLDKVLNALLSTSPEIHLSRSGNEIILKK
jgi:transmembrane sensor